MNNKVRTQSWNQNQIEWNKDFNAITMAAAKAQATRWINRQGFKVEKEEITKHYQVWEVK